MARPTSKTMNHSSRFNSRGSLGRNQSLGVGQKTSTNGSRTRNHKENIPVLQTTDLVNHRTKLVVPTSPNSQSLRKSYNPGVVETEA